MNSSIYYPRFSTVLLEEAIEDRTKP